MIFFSLPIQQSSSASQQDTPFVLAFSVVMLNTDVHNPANKHKMTKEEFVRNNRGIDGDGDLPREMLEAVSK